MGIKTVNEVIEQIQAKTGEDGKRIINRFSKKNFETLLTAMINDKSFKSMAVKVKKGEKIGEEEICASEIFRAYTKKILEKAGVDKEESKKILEEDFTFDMLKGFYEIFASTLYTYMDAGNKFDMVPASRFKGSIYIRENSPSTKTAETFHPKTRENLGTFKTDKEAFQSLAVKSACPMYLKKRTKLK